MTGPEQEEYFPVWQKQPKRFHQQMAHCTFEKTCTSLQRFLQALAQKRANKKYLSI
ncbi:hypothetical protein ACX0KY_03700 [Pseudomonas extremorientalis]|jgi:hypothetical protein|uniref:hypothetical protein n=1 Tax=Pseudomonas TaxID=286 RepID=UPI001C99F4F2|nr:MULTISPECIES: hypothetical protein [Pseudomonas]QZP22002.1 hypothetical protein K5K89_04530 [Pseudomonas sp. DR208]WLG57612.1 hypothetical protein PSH77_03605 [Pseudomonas extremorientalis]